VSKKEILYKSIFLVPSFALMFFIFFGLSVYLHPLDPKLSFFAGKLFSHSILFNLAKTLLFASAALALSVVTGILFSKTKHGGAGDIWLSFLNFVLISIPVSALFFILVFVFSKVFKLLPLKGYFNIISYVLPSALVGLFFSFYISFKARFEKYADNKSKKKGFKTAGIVLKQFSGEMWLFIFIIAFTETVFALPGIGGEFIKNINKPYSSLHYGIYLSGLFIVLRYILSLLSFAFYRTKD
jgi:ABC-type dipeptide/oligopeptide/nickel transport system permease component